MNKETIVTEKTTDYPANFPAEDFEAPSEGSFSGFGGRRLFLKRYACRQKKAALIVVHGMSESGKRYDAFAKHLSGRGCEVFVPDLRAHGRTAPSKSEIGMPEEGGNLFADSVKDIELLISEVKAACQGVPVYLLGHSYGSFVSQNVLETDAAALLTGAVLSGSAYFKSPVNVMGLPVAFLGGIFKGKRAPAKLIKKLSFGSYEKRFEGGNWLSREGKVKTDYDADGDNTHTFSMGFYSDFTSGALKLYSKKAAEKLNKNVRLFILSGAMDPVGGFGKSVKKLAAFYRRSGMHDIRVKLYEGGRHEMLNESNKEEVYQDIAGFMGV